MICVAKGRGFGPTTTKYAAMVMNAPMIAAGAGAGSALPKLKSINGVENVDASALPRYSTDKIQSASSSQPVNQ